MSCPPGDAKRCLADIRRAAEQFAREMPDADEKALWESLGELKDAARMYHETLDPERVDQCRRRKRLLQRLLIGAIMAAVFAPLYAVYIEND